MGTLGWYGDDAATLSFGITTAALPRTGHGKSERRRGMVVVVVGGRTVVVVVGGTVVVVGGTVVVVVGTVVVVVGGTVVVVVVVVDPATEGIEASSNPATTTPGTTSELIRRRFRREKDCTEQMYLVNCAVSGRVPSSIKFR